jgi:hypothetical protein
VAGAEGRTLCATPPGGQRSFSLSIDSYGEVLADLLAGAG